MTTADQRIEWAAHYVGLSIKDHNLFGCQERIKVIGWEESFIGNGVWLKLANGNKTYRQYPRLLK